MPMFQSFYTPSLVCVTSLLFAACVSGARANAPGRLETLQAQVDNLSQSVTTHQQCVHAANPALLKEMRSSVQQIADTLQTATEADFETLSAVELQILKLQPKYADAFVACATTPAAPTPGGTATPSARDIFLYDIAKLADDVTKNRSCLESDDPQLGTELTALIADLEETIRSQSVIDASTIEALRRTVLLPVQQAVANAIVPCKMTRPVAPAGSSTPTPTPPEPIAPVAPKEPTCKRKVARQVMSGGKVQTLMVDSAPCLKEWMAFETESVKFRKAGAEYRTEMLLYTQAKDRELAITKGWHSPTFGAMMWVTPRTLVNARNRENTLTHGYWIMEHEVTQSEWQSVMGKNPSTRQKGDSCSLDATSSDLAPNEPVHCVSWDEAEEFARRASEIDGVTYRLPTDLQWALAARGASSGIFAGGDNASAVGWYQENSEGRIHACCQMARNGYGLCDMSGNVSEWTNDRFKASDFDFNLYYITRGGNWGEPAINARVDGNHGVTAAISTFRSPTIGLRLVR